MSRPKKIADDCRSVSCPSKRDCILSAAQEIFLEMGYGAASMDAVAARANVSKATIYAHFDNKRALFDQVIRGRCRRFFQGGDILAQVDAASDARSALRQFASDLLSIILSPGALAINRVVVAEAPRLPEVGETYYAAGPVPAQARVTAMFNDLTRRGLLAVPENEAPLVAELFLNMLKGDLHTRALLGVAPSRDDHAPLVRIAVELILARYGARPSAVSGGP
ncbi:TetR/AcrR family transcriptional regulator [Telmatospirillum sp.]|uniref:TetR/AcrR family transcriptional regulator n=1 Tax=Telmatospirillum sp. TaxID=2079197 RepID=UPI00283D44FA|nr:TetR/AcrR family transcriptional regulator [Telmatospirillum sp.]MDR3439186.1 TetR/AcrR family transcriptional regulator [Telmatospirillum sp.]